MEAGKKYYLRIRTANYHRGIDSIEVQTQPGSAQNRLNFVSPVVYGKGRDQIKIGDLALFGEKDKESVELIVKSIEPGEDLTARLVCVDAAQFLTSPTLIWEPKKDNEAGLQDLLESTNPSRSPNDQAQTR